MIVSAFLVPGNPLPRLKPEVESYRRIARAFEKAGGALAASRPDVILAYSTQWIAVLDQLWLTRRRSTGMHVDENWYEFGDLPYDIYADSILAQDCVEASPRSGIHARGVDYDGFPIDTGTIVAAQLLGVGNADRPLVIGSNNVYHDPAKTETLARIAADCAEKRGKRVTVVGIGGLSGSLFREEIDLASDHVATPSDDKWNSRILRLMEAGDVAELRRLIPEYADAARVDFGFKHLHWILGALGGTFRSATVHGYGALYGSGAAVVEFTI